MTSQTDNPRADGLLTAGIGSLPFADAERAARFVLEDGPTVPFWPQLPRRNFSEQMMSQYSEGMPCVRVEAEKGRMEVDVSAKYVELEPFYEKFLAGDASLFAISEDAAKGFYAFERAAAGRTWRLVKGQVTGPITFASSIADADRKPLYADADLRDAAAKLLTRKAEWQIERLQPFASEAVVIFVDEPVLAAYGSSAYLNILEEHVHKLVGEVLQGIHAAGGVSGMHVCGNSDWGMVIRSGIQIVNFDAYQYGPTLALYPEDVHALLDRGGRIAWGIVPTTNDIRTATTDALMARLEECFRALTAKGVSENVLWNRSILTPSCGTGGLSEADARRVFELLEELRWKFGR